MKRTRLVAIFAVLALVVAACGESDADTTTTTAGEAPETTEPDTTDPTDPDEAPEGEAGQGGHFVALQWQAVSIVNNYLSSGSKDLMAGSLALEPLAAFSQDTTLVPKLAVDIPTLDNGGVAEDLMSVTWTLQEGVVWSDGTPLTAEDVVFSWQYCTAEGSGCSFTDRFAGVADVVAEDDLTVRIEFDEPTPFPYFPFTSSQSPVIQAAQFADCLGEAALECTEANQFPIGTGPFIVTDFRAEDTVLYEYNPLYRDNAEGKPFFGTFEIKGGGDAAAAATSVLQVGDADYAWNLQVAPDVLANMEADGLGYVDVGLNANLEHINLNQTNNRNEDSPSDYLGGDNPHPIFHDAPELSRAMSMAIDRDELVAVGYGDTGVAVCNVWNPPPASTNTDWCLTQDIEGANALLDEAGYEFNADGIRETPDGIPLVFDFSTSTNQVRQDFQALIEQYWAEIGIQANMRNADAGVFFDGTGANPDSYVAFLADILMYTFVPDPNAAALLVQYTTGEIMDSTTGFSGSNVPRYSDPEYDALYAQLAETGDPDERDQLTIALNDHLIDAGVVIPLVWRGSVSAFANDIAGVGGLNGWDSEYWNVSDWYRE